MEQTHVNVNDTYYDGFLLFFLLLQIDLCSFLVQRKIFECTNRYTFDLC